MKRWLAIFLVAVILVGTLATGLLGGVLLDRHLLLNYVPPQEIPADAQADFGLMAEAWNLIEQWYVDRSAVDGTTLTHGAIAGMANALGDTGHTRFLTPEEVAASRESERGSFEGIGAAVQMVDDEVVIASVMENSPAKAAGVLPGDVILAVDGTSVEGMSLEDVVAKVKGPAGSTVTLTLRSAADSQTRDVQVKRAVIQIESVSWAMTPGTTIAHVYIAAFSGGASADLRQALTEARDQGATAVILDLRDDAGGLLEEAVTSASQFLSSGNVVLRRDAQGKETPMAVEAGGVDPDLPMVVLVNGGTASAAEIVAGALQDAGRASLIGTQTFGTGTVLRQFSLSDGSALWLATEEWLTPAGRTIWHQGLTPDQVVDLPAGVVPLTPDDLKDMTADQVQASQDAQFLDALAALQSTEQTLSAAPLG